MSAKNNKKATLNVVKISREQPRQSGLGISLTLPSKTQEVIKKTRLANIQAVDAENEKIVPLELAVNEVSAKMPALRQRHTDAERIALDAEIAFWKARAAHFEAKANLNEGLKDCYFAEGQLESMKNVRHGISENGLGREHGLRLAVAMSEGYNPDYIENFGYSEKAIKIDYNVPQMPVETVEETPEETVEETTNTEGV